MTKKIKTICNGLVFLLRNLLYFSRLTKIDTVKVTDEIVVKGASAKELKEMYSVHSEAFGCQTSLLHRALYRFLSKKCVFIAKDISSNRVIGFMLYYANKRDCIEKTVHATSLGVSSASRGKKIGTILGIQAKNHFKNNNLNGISAWVSLSNQAALKVDMKAGFKPIEKSFCKNENEERYYMILPTNDNKKWDFIDIEIL